MAKEKTVKTIPIIHLKRLEKYVNETKEILERFKIIAKCLNESRKGN